MSGTQGPKALVAGISGCSSSGKTTLARLLRDIFPSTFILHQDDFYKPEAELPSRDGLIDWDCSQALDIAALSDALSHIRQHAVFPPTLESKEDDNSVGQCPVAESTVASLKARVDDALPASHPLRSGKLRLCFLDGFLLYSPSMAALQAHFDMKLFVRTSYASAKARREARDGYVTLEGFWKDPPGYVDKIVWPNYVREHAWMFERGDVEGAYDEAAVEKEGIRVLGEAAVDSSLEQTLVWMVESVLDELKKHQ
ncbi:uncharacterized protein UV8b_07258 [Ustilaginoidea virens]|uniref:Uncharacterized protein n=1 Tax=Ustilaginoidea virens TaxID=1159556 RepID=A0A063BQW1_USTVR|nr:uncharacterized protein UV8b_07258 [Ustilaginoidea virens]QUC23017.1 hypothetical protein UV8b_07258 [Ustilaginoidea virens]GAO19093.1 hypothetical protein UVI_02042070 [Ustilaginoidea virens]